MKKFFIGFAIAVVLILAVAVFATAAENSEDYNLSEQEEKQIEEQVDKVAEEQIGKEAEGYVKEFVGKKGIEAEAIKEISKVDFNDLPKEVNIENVDDTNLAIYQIDYEEENKDKQVFVISYSVEELKAQGDLIISHDKRQFLHFGFSGEMLEDGFLKTATGVETSFEKGYVMIREGSITAISTNLEAVDGKGEIEIIIYKNSEEIGFGNTLVADSAGVKKDYDVQSKDVVSFEPGDVISAYAKASGDVRWSDVITMIEITTIN